MAKKSQSKTSTKKDKVEKLRKVHAVIEEIEGKKYIFCPECDEIPTVDTVDYDITSDGKYVWFAYHCPRCKIHVIHFSEPSLKGICDVSHEYDVQGRPLNRKFNKLVKPEKAGKKPPMQKVGNVKRKLILPMME